MFGNIGYNNFPMRTHIFYNVKMEYVDMYVCVLDIDQRDLRTKDENKLRHMKQKQFHLVGVVVVVTEAVILFEFFFTFAHYYIFSLNTTFPGI